MSEYKLGDDLIPSDNILDPITFEDIILAVHCNDKIINEAAVMKEWRAALEMRMEDALYLLKNNLAELVAASKHGRDMD